MQLFPTNLRIESIETYDCYVFVRLKWLKEPKGLVQRHGRARTQKSKHFVFTLSSRRDRSPEALEDLTRATKRAELKGMWYSILADESETGENGSSYLGLDTTGACTTLHDVLSYPIRFCDVSTLGSYVDPLS